MHRLGYTRTSVHLGIFIVVLLSANAQAGEVFATKAFMTAPLQSATYHRGTSNNLYKAALRPALEGRQEPAGSASNQWITAPAEAFRSTAPQPPRLRF